MQYIGRGSAHVQTIPRVPPIVNTGYFVFEPATFLLWAGTSHTFPLRDDAFQITAAYKLEQFLSPFFDVVAVKLSDMIHAQGNTIRPPAYGQRRELWLKLGGCWNVTVKRL